MLPPTARRSIIAKLALIRALENPNSREQSQCLILYICPDDSNLQEIATKLNRWLEKEDLAVDFFPGDKVSAKLYRILVSPKPPKGLALTPEAFVCALMYPRISSSFGSKGCPKLIIINDGTSHESKQAAPVNPG